MTVALPLAHLGHWVGPLYAAPVLILVLWLLIESRRERRSRR